MATSEMCVWRSSTVAGFSGNELGRRRNAISSFAKAEAAMRNHIPALLSERRLRPASAASSQPLRELYAQDGVSRRTHFGYARRRDTRASAQRQRGRQGTFDA